MLPRYRIDNHTEIPDWYECANGHRQKIIKSLIKKHRNKLVNEYPKFVVMAIGLLAFSYELFNFGSGAYVGYYGIFSFGGFLIGISAGWLHRIRVKRMEDAEDLKRTEEAVDGKSKSTEAMPSAGISSYAAHAKEIEKEDD